MRSGEKVLSVEVEMPHAEADMALTVESPARFYLVANALTLLSLLQMWRQTQQSGFDLSFYTSAASQRAQTYIKEGRAAMNNLLKTGGVSRGMKLDISLNAPLLIVPADIFDPTTACLAVELG